MIFLVIASRFFLLFFIIKT